MLFGHNSNVKVGEMLYHVQTEDRGASHAVIDTMVYHSGRVLHRRANSYADLLPLDAAREQALKDRVSTQHQAILDELRSGVLKLAQQAPPTSTRRNAIHPESLGAECSPGPSKLARARHPAEANPHSCSRAGAARARCDTPSYR